MFDVNAYLCSAIVAGSGSGVVGMNRRVETEGAWHVHPARSAGVNHVIDGDIRRGAVHGRH